MVTLKKVHFMERKFFLVKQIGVADSLNHGLNVTCLTWIQLGRPRSLHLEVYIVYGLKYLQYLP